MRERIGAVYIYFSSNSMRHKKQCRERRSHQASLNLLANNPNLAIEKAKAAIVLFLASLDERQRRLYAGLESLKIGHGGDEHIAQLFGLNRHTIAKGRKELLSDTQSVSSIRSDGAGRLSTEKKRLKFSRT